MDVIERLVDPTEQEIVDAFIAFHRDENPTLLYLALDDLEDALRDAGQEDRAACKRALSLLLSFLATLDQYIDPKWDPSETPVRTVPPPVPGLAVYSSGEVDPTEIADPATRTLYEQELKKRRDDLKHYGLQFQLRRINERATADVSRFVKRCYTSSSAERLEFEELLAMSSLSVVRRKSFRKLVRAYLLWFR